MNYRCYVGTRVVYNPSKYDGMGKKEGSYLYLVLNQLKSRYIINLKPSLVTLSSPTQRSVAGFFFLDKGFLPIYSYLEL